MNLYLISQNKNNRYDTYDSAVVAAPDESTARNMNPVTGDQMMEERWACPYNGWAPSIEFVSVKYLGQAAHGIEQGVICASFNAG